MQSFLTKINPDLEFKQFLPNKTRKRKGTPKTINKEISGLTGNSLVNKVCEIISKHNSEIQNCRAILIEDDLDGRFYGMHPNDVNAYNTKIAEKVREALKRPDFPVILLYASPEIESWFIADWENGFKKLYCNSRIVTSLDYRTRQFFATNLKVFINDHVLRQYADDIEEYGWFGNTYLKLSEQLMKAIRTDSKQYISQLHGTNREIVDQILDSKELYYNKNLHGDIMLRNIDPVTVSRKCRKYFSPAFNKLGYC